VWCVPGPETHELLRRSEPLDEAGCAALVDSARVLSTPSRVRLLWALRGGELSVAELAEAAGVAPAAASQQLRVLRLARFVDARREGQSIRYRLHDDHIAALLEELRNHAEHARLGWSSQPPDRPATAERT